MPSYRALTGIDYKSKKTGKATRVELGGKIDDMNEEAIRHELEAGNIELWNEGKKEVKKDDDTSV